jgi:internalin A
MMLELLLTRQDPLDQQVIGNAEGLEGLELSSLGISDLSPLTSMTQLEQLTLSNNNIADLSALSGMSNLKSLDISGNKVSNLTPISTLSKLTELRAMSNQIVDVQPLKDLESLRDVWLSNNKITNANDLANVKSGLFLENNSIQEIGALSDGPDLFLNGNQIASISDFEPTKVQRLNLSNNPVATDYKKIQALFDSYAARNGQDKLPFFRINVDYSDPPFEVPTRPNSSAYINTSKTILACNVMGFGTEGKMPRYWPTCGDTTTITGLRHLRP